MFDFKNLINSMVGKSGQDDSVTVASPFAESATKLVQRLPQEEYYGAHIEIIKAIGRLNKDDNTSLEERVRTLLYVDERTFPIHRTICEDYFKPENAKRNYIPAILAYVNELATGYHDCLRRFSMEGLPKELFPQITLATVRGLVHHNQQILWYALRYMEPQAVVWKQAYQFYIFLEKMRLSREPVKAYNSIPGSETIPEQVLLHSAFLKIANTSALSMQEIRQLHYILGQACKMLHIQPTPGELTEPVFMVNLATDEAPHLYRRNSSELYSRYWSGGVFFDTIKTVIDGISQNKALNKDEILPEYVVDDPHKNIPEHWGEFFGKIQKCLLEPEYQLSPADMALAAEEVFVTLGFNLIAFKSKQELSIPSERERLESRWVMTGIGHSTIDLIHFAQKHNNLLIGDALLLEFVDKLPVFGVINRIVKKDGGQTRITIDIIGRSPIAINLFDPENPSASFFGLYVTHDNSEKSKRVLLIPNAMVKTNKKIELSTSGQSYMIQLENVDRYFNECAACQFSTVSRQN